MPQPKVLIVVITKDIVEPGCLHGIHQQGVPWIIRGDHVQSLDQDPMIRYNRSLAENREAARVMALASDADFFLFLDSDIQLPPNAINEFLKQINLRNAAPVLPGIQTIPNQKHIQCGWFKMKFREHWVGGVFVDDLTLQYFLCPEVSLTRTDLVATGCMFISRQALSSLKFHCDGSMYMKDTQGNAYMVDEAMQFSIDADKAGYLMYMNGSVVCQHLSRGDREPDYGPKSGLNI